MGLIQIQALISTPKNIEHGVHHTFESRQEKMVCDVPHLWQFTPAQARIFNKLECISVSLDVTKLADFW